MDNMSKVQLLAVRVTKTGSKPTKHACTAPGQMRTWRSFPTDMIIEIKHLASVRIVIWRHCRDSRSLLNTGGPGKYHRIFGCSKSPRLENNSPFVLDC
jgi:hypothetical protein